MKYFLTLILIVLVYLGYSFIHFKLVLKKATNPEIIQTVRDLGTGPKLIYLAAGDSTAQGTGASKVEKTYPYQLAEYLAQSHSVHYRNIGISGAKLQDLIDIQLPQIIEAQPDIITISIGGNDIDRLATEEYVMGKLQEILTELTTKTRATIYLANLPNFKGASLLPAPYLWLVEHRSKPMNEAITKLESDRVKIANVHDFFGNATNKKATYSSDQFHPSDAGYGHWVDAFLVKMKSE